MTRLLKYVAMAGTLLMAVSVQAESPGFVEGQLRIVSSRGAELADDHSSKPQQSYAEYPLLVLSKDRRREVAQIKPNEQGHYRIALPPGEYILDVKKRGGHRLGTASQPFKIVSEQTVHVDLEIGPDIGIM